MEKRDFRGLGERILGLEERFLAINERKRLCIKNKIKLDECSNLSGFWARRVAEIGIGSQYRLQLWQLSSKESHVCQLQASYLQSSHLVSRERALLYHSQGGPP